MITIQKASIEAAREAWIKIAKRRNWYKEPFYIAVWVSKHGNVMDALCTTQILNNCTADIIKSNETDRELKPEQYEIV